MSHPATVVTDAIIDYVVTRLAYSVRKFQLKKEVSLILYGEAKEEVDRIVNGVSVKVKVGTGLPVKKVEISAFEKICSRARKVLHERSVSGSVEARKESIGFYENLIADENVHPNIKIKARSNLDKIQGVADHSGFSIPPISGTIQHQVIDIDKLDLTQEQLKKLLDMKRESGSS